jgi:ribosomal RNA-processing protein 12
VKSVEENGGFELDSLSGDATVLGTTSSAILPILFKFVSDMHTSVSINKVDNMDIEEQSSKESTNPMDSFQKLQSVTDAITSLARFAPEGFVKGLFKKVMQRLLEEVQSESSDNERICSLLTLSQALVASKVLDDASMSFLFRALKPLIKNDEHGPRVQKRAYKVLSELCERHHSFVAESERLHELSLLLTGTIMTSQVAARYMRLKCLNIIVDGLDQSNQEQIVRSLYIVSQVNFVSSHFDVARTVQKDLYKVVPEVLLCLKDSNAKTREAAYQLLLSLSCSGDIVEFVKVTVAALGSESSHMRSAVVMALSRLVFEQGWENDTFYSLLPGLLKTVLVVIHEGSREVIKSVIGFIRICVAAIPSEQLEPLVPELVGSMLKSQYAKSRFRAKIKIILKKLVKRYGYDALMPHVPVSETRLLTHIRKLDEREKRKKQIQRESAKVGAEDYDAMVDSDEDDSDDGRTFMTGATGLTRKSRGGKTLDGKSIAASKRSLVSGAGTAASSKTKTGANSNFRLPNEADGEVVDMLSSKAVQRVQFDDDADSDSDDDSSMEMNFDDDGKLVVRGEDDGSKTTEADELLPMSGSAKRRRLSGSVTEQDKKTQTRKSSSHPKGGIGASYKSKKAGGDVKKKGQKYEPFAFVPLDGRAYTKKNRRSAVEQMSTVVRQGGKRKRQASRGHK